MSETSTLIKPPFVLTQWETMDLQEHLQSRPDMWHGVDARTWTRVHEAEPVVVLRFTNGHPTPDGLDLLCGVAFKPVGKWTLAQSVDYVGWLLCKYTSYEERMRLEALLAPVVKEGTDVQLLVRNMLRPGTYPPRGTEDDERPTQEPLWENDDAPECAVDFERGIVYTELLRYGGWLTVRCQADMLEADIKLAAPTTKGDERTKQHMQLKGIVRSEGFEGRRALELLTCWAADGAEIHRQRQTVRRTADDPVVVPPVGDVVNASKSPAASPTAVKRSSYLKNLLKGAQ